MHATVATLDAALATYILATLNFCRLSRMHSAGSSLSAVSYAGQKHGVQSDAWAAPLKD